MGEKGNVDRLLVRKPDGKRPLGRPRHRWVDNIKMDLLEVVSTGLVWLRNEQVESSCECDNEPLASIKCWETIEWPHNCWPLE
jgi:hypothetical protein